MKQYLDLLQDILDNGEQKDDRTGTGTISVFGRSIKFDLRRGFPAVTTKKLAWKAVVSELLWFIEGSGDEGRLREILYGSRDARTDHGVSKKTIWSDNANAEYWKAKSEFPGDLGRVYGVQWRHWAGKITKADPVFANIGAEGARLEGVINVEREEIDQLDNLIKGLKEDPNGRRHIVVSYNPGEIDQMALPPCHAMFQMYVSKNKLSCQMYQRSGDAFLGIPFNIASYALLTHMIAQVCNMEVGELILVFGDVHIYKNHIDQVNELLSREPMEAPTLCLNPGIKDINSFSMDDINLVNYKSHPALIAPMAV